MFRRILGASRIGCVEAVRVNDSRHGTYEGGWEYRLLSITGHSTGTTRRFRSAHRLYSCALPRLAELRFSNTRLMSLRRNTLSIGSWPPTPITLRAFFFRIRQMSLLSR